MQSLQSVDLSVEGEYLVLDGESQRVLQLMISPAGIEWFELFGFDGGGNDPSGGLYDGPLFDGESLCYEPARNNFYTTIDCGADQTVLQALEEQIVLGQGWETLDGTLCEPDSFCWITQDGTVKLGIEIATFEAGESYLQMVPNQNPENFGFTIKTAKNITARVNLLDYSSDADGDVLFFEIDDSNTTGAIELNKETGEIRYIPQADSIQPDSFLFRSSDQFGFSQWAEVQILISETLPIGVYCGKATGDKSNWSPSCLNQDVSRFGQASFAK